MIVGLQVTKNDFWFCLMKFLSSEVFPSSETKGDLAESMDIGSDLLERNEIAGDDDVPESVKDEDMDEQSNFFELLHSKFAPSRRLKPLFFETDTLVQLQDLKVFYLFRGVNCASCLTAWFCRIDTSHPFCWSQGT